MQAIVDERFKYFKSNRWLIVLNGVVLLQDSNIQDKRGIMQSHISQFIVAVC